MDIHFQPVPEGQVRGWKVFTFGYRSALKVEGLQALVNRWTRVLVTPKGSDPLDLSFGTEFGDLIGSNIPKSARSSLIDIVAIAIDDANEQVMEQDRIAQYDEHEALENAQMVRFHPSAAGDGFQVWVEIQNRAGENLVTRLADYSDR